MSVGDTSTTPAGWYPDPADDARLRRWDGSAWTQDVILAPEEAPVASIPPRSTPAPTENLAPPPLFEPATAPTSPAPAAPAAPIVPPASAAPPPPSAAPTFLPPGAEPAEAARPTVPRASPDVAHPNPPSGPVSLPEWATLPGLTLPPDLSGLPGFEPDTIVLTPTFEEEPAQPTPQLPRPDWSQEPILERPAFEPLPDEPVAQAVPSVTAPVTAPSASANFPPPPNPPRRGGSQPAAPERYAPPPAGAQYDVPPPPGAAHVPSPGFALPASSLVAPPGLPKAAWAAGPEIARSAVAPISFESLPRTSAPDELAPSGNLLTLWVWLIALLPAIQFAVVYLVFSELGLSFAPGMQWGILAAPAAIGLLLASGDRRKLVNLGVERAPSPLLAIVPPIYLLVRTVDVSRASAVALVGWFLLQAAAAAGVYYLLPSLLAQAINSIGI